MMRSGLAVIAVVGAVLALPATGLGAATVNRFTSTTQVGPDLVDDVGCGLPVGVLTGTETQDYQVVQLDDGSTHVEGTDTLVYRVDFPNGDYFIGPSATTHFRLNESSPADTVTFGGAGVDRGTLYDASGHAIGTVTGHVFFHTTIAQGTVTVSFDRNFITCT
jgi:hypothetical protein